ncbi:ABC transporter permease subunit [Clostridium sp. HBUAS56017]|uniref:ABC transporter permease subunit n=1 Tax=Clostridium sp. HBUAS56017 TaxID=2571128 RepID=UPI0011779D26|nr:ABC transporter permease subunit [Clostridium sp. HBUAS56017]
MINIIKNELSKLYHRKKILSMFLIMAIVTFGFIFIINLDSGQNRYNKELDFINRLKTQSSNLTEGAEKDDIDSRIETIQKSLDYYDNLKDDNFNWIQYLKDENHNLEQSSNTDTKDAKIAINNYLIDNNIKPLSNLSMDSNEFFLAYLRVLGKVLMFIIIALTLSDCITSEYTNNTIQLILLRPISKFKLILGKLIANCIAVIGCIISFDLIAYISSGLLWGFGTLKAPELIFSKFASSTTLNTTYNQFISPIDNTASYISAGNLIFKALLLQLLFAISCICFCTLISLLFKNTLTVISINILFPILTLLISVSNSFNEIKKIFCYLFSFLGDSVSIVDRSIVTSTGACFLTYKFAILVITTWIIVFIILMYLSRNKLKSK